MGLPLRVPLGLLLAGYGFLVLVGVMPHEATLAGLASLLAGLALLAPSLSRIPAVATALPASRTRLIGLFGLLLAVGVLAYNGLRRSSLSPPEWGILAYGVALAAASPFLGRKVGPTTMATLVGWSFPLLMAPLALFALNGILSSGTGATAASPLVQVLVVQPAAAGLRLTGMPVEVTGSTMLVQTERGLLSLGVGLVCAGLYPIVLFAGLVAFHAWNDRLPWKNAAILVGAGIAGLWVLNLLRLVALARVGVAWGPAALQSAHAHLGWVLFGLYMALFWFVALRGPAPAKQAGP